MSGFLVSGGRTPCFCQVAACFWLPAPWQRDHVQRPHRCAQLPLKSLKRDDTLVLFFNRDIRSKSFTKGQGNEQLALKASGTSFDSHAGVRLDAPIFFGPTFYQRLKHMVDDKVHARCVAVVTAGGSLACTLRLV